VKLILASIHHTAILAGAACQHGLERARVNKIMAETRGGTVTAQSNHRADDRQQTQMDTDKESLKTPIGREYNRVWLRLGPMRKKAKTHGGPWVSLAAKRARLWAILNPKGILPQSPRLRATSYHGSPPNHPSQPQRGCGHRRLCLQRLLGIW
jgi:hypothetical protein